METEWLLKRNCSMSPRRTVWVYGSLCIVVLIVGAGFALHGAWPALIFAAFDIIALTLALLHYARHATDFERVVLAEGCLLVQRIDGGKLRQVCLDSCWTRIALPDREHALIVLEARGIKVQIGAFVSEDIRAQVGQELRSALRSRSFLQ